MYKIKGFTTTKDIVDQLVKAKVKFKLPFTATPELDVTKDPFIGVDVYGSDGKKQKIVKKTKTQLKSKYK